jgi:hypothetical protein
MHLDRGDLAKLDRGLFAALDHDERFQMVRVPVTPATWSTWKRYCDAAGVAMGRAIGALIDHELVAVLDGPSVDGSPVLSPRAEQRLRAREAELDRREADLAATQERLERWSRSLSAWDDDLGARERLTGIPAKPGADPTNGRAEVGRNNRCPCGSGFKSKLCHGLTSSRRPRLDR